MVSGNRRIGVVCNALDFFDDPLRRAEAQEQELADLEGLGLDPEPVDLRDFFQQPGGLQRLCDTLDALWVTGGNTFVLRRAMQYSGLDTILLARAGDNRFVYAGYSAGACVVTPSLEGIDLADDPNVIPDGYRPEVTWHGLSLVPFCIAPHYKSNHPESDVIGDVVEFYIASKIPFIALRDGDVYIEDSTAEAVAPLDWT